MAHAVLFEVVLDSSLEAKYTIKQYTILRHVGVRTSAAAGKLRRARAVR